MYYYKIVNACVRINDFRAEHDIVVPSVRLHVEPVQQPSQSKNDISSAGLCSECQLPGRATEGDGMTMEGLAALSSAMMSGCNWISVEFASV